MFKIRFGEIYWISITNGYNCMDSTDCNCRDKCKYCRISFRFHNWSAKVHNFFEYRLHIKLPHILYIGKKDTWLSGTTKCPFNKPRRYTCYHCKSHGGFDEYYGGLCSNEDYIRLNKEGRSMEHYVEGQSYCKFFEKDEWADKYDKNTGETIWN